MTRPTFLLAFVFALILAISPFNASAADINDEGAQRLKIIFEELISYQKSISELAEDGKLIYQGDVIVEPSDEYYAVTLPHVSILYPKGQRLELGIVSVNAVPHDQEGQWKMTVAMPTPIILFDKSGAPALQLDIGSQLSAGIWHEELEYFTKLDARYQDIKIESPDGTFRTAIAEAEILYDLNEDDQGRWSGPLKGTIRKIAMNFEKTGGTITMKEAKLGVELFSYIPQAIKDYKEKLIAMAEAGSDGNVSSQHITGLYNMIVELLGNAGDGFTAQYEVSDLDITRPVDPDTESEEKRLESFHFGKLSMGFDLTGFLNNQVKLALRFGFNDLKAPPSDDESMKGIMPTTGHIDVQLNDIPYQKIADLGRNSIAGKAGMVHMATFALKIPAILSEAGTTMTFTDNHFGNDAYHVNANGKIRADISALNSATADIRLTAKGLEQLKANMALEGDDPLNENAQNFQKIAAQLQILQVLAAKEKDGLGNLIHILEFEMNKQGEMLMNGQDIRLLFDGRAADRAKPQEPEAAPEQAPAPEAAPTPQPQQVEPAAPAEDTAP
ncbi:MAG: hypothetical protein DHS20C02_09830 [Micavibrio sp.]|nr:MAG: hypothetical protein DHS20C02_09830 [Micavibrio sp.]